MPLSITCPGCREPLDVDEEYRTWKVRCPRCDAEFVPDDRRPDLPPPAPRPRRDRYEDEDDDDYDRPRRRRRRRFSRADHDEAVADVYGPAIGLEILGWLGVLATLGLVAAVVAGGAAANRPGAPRNNDAEVFIFLGVCMGVFGLPYSLAMTAAGRHLRRLTSRGWATAGACLGIAGFVLFGLFGVFHLAVGIWVLVAINRPHVKAALDYQSRYGAPPDDYDD
ncbi:hypothetical protein J0H58_26900 [bacterium]|nr:hypothetical protein [bacterium]